MEGLRNETRIIIKVIAAIILVTAAWAASGILFLIFGAVLGATLLSAAADWLSARSALSRGAALAVVIIALLGVSAALGYLVSQRVTDQVHELSTQLPAAFTQLTGRLNATDWGSRVIYELHRFVRAMNGGHMLGTMTGIFSSTIGIVASVFLLFVLSIYFASNPGLYRSGVLDLFIPASRDRIGQVFNEIAGTLRHWFLGKLILMCYVAVATTIALALLGVPLAFTLGLIAGIADFVPNFGPPVAAIPALLLAFVQSPMTAVWVALIYLAVQISENHVLTPLVQRRAVNLPPALTIIGQALMAAWFGLVGVIFATPLAAAAQVAIKRFYVQDYWKRE